MMESLFRRKEFSYTCSECGEVHNGSPSYSFQFPSFYFDVPEAERADRVHMNDDLCRIAPQQDDPDDEATYYIRTVLEIPIKGVVDPFIWGVWVTQSKSSFEKYAETFEEDQSDEQSFGWLAVNMPFYNAVPQGQALVHLECDVEWGSAGSRPKVHLWENDHQLSIDQKSGISWKKAIAIANMANAQFHAVD